MIAPNATTAADGVAVRLDLHEAVLVVIDPQNDFCHPDGLQARLGKDVNRLQEPLRRLQDFIGAARRFDVPVVFVQTLHSPETDSPAWRQRHLVPDRPQTCQEGSWGADFFHVAPLEGDPVVRKHRYSAFAGTQGRQIIHRLGRSSLLFCGFSTEVCVESSVREAVCRDYLATLVEDCCGDYTQAAHDRAVAAVASGFGLVANSQDIVRDWAAMAGAPQAPSADAGGAE